MRQKLLAALGKRQDRVFEWQRALTAFKAVGPLSEGQGEWDKAVWIETTLRQAGITDIEHFDVDDPTVPAGKRPNLVARVPGRSKKTLWILGHMDVVPPGELSLWHSDPWTVIRDSQDPDLMRGRGVEDNQQAIVAGALVACELLELGLTPNLGLGLIFVSDEETGNRFGAEHVFKMCPNLVARDDLVIVPDFGTKDGGMIEIAEKSVLWIKVTVNGKQCHASTPEEGVNTIVAAADMIMNLPALENRFSAVNNLFTPNRTTITPTRHDANVPNVNTIPGKDVFFIDSRVLPDYDPEQIYDAIKQLARQIEARHGVNISTEIVNYDLAAKPTQEHSEIVVKIKQAIKAVYDIDCYVGGVGGSTVASFVRKLGIPAAVWARLMPNFHMPNEASRISANIGDAQVYAWILFEE